MDLIGITPKRRKELLSSASGIYSKVKLTLLVNLITRLLLEKIPFCFWVLI